MAELTEVEKGKSDGSGEKDAADFGRDVCECIAHAANHKVLEGCGVLCERGLVDWFSKVPFSHEACG